MAIGLSTKRAIAGACQLIACLALMANPVVALAQYQSRAAACLSLLLSRRPSGGKHPRLEL